MSRATPLGRAGEGPVAHARLLPPVAFALLLLLSPIPLGGQGFEERAREAGIDHHCYDSHRMCGGIAFFDYDGDGWEDLYLTGGEEADHLYRNQRDGTFRDVTEDAELSFMEDFHTMGVVTGDVNNDGDREIFVTTWKDQRNVLLRNEGDGTFTDITESSGVGDDEVWSMSAAFGDYDLDGYLDLYVGNYARYDDLPFDENLTGGIENYLYRNNGDGTFRDVAGEVGVQDVDGLTLAVAFTDFDGDGDPDLYVANDFGYLFESNALYRNEHPENRFTDIREESGTNAEINAMGLAVGDYDEDGDLDFFVSNMGHNVFYRNEGGARFREVGEEMGIQDRYATGWGTAFLDFDNDGQLDLVLANGRVLPRYNMENLSHVNRLLRPHENRLWRGTPGGSSGPVFAEVSRAVGVADSTRSRGLGYADYDRDGDLDLAFAGMRHKESVAARALLFRNDLRGRGHWLQVRLEGRTSNRDGFGSRLVAWAGDRRWVREVRGGSSYMSQNSSVAHFGLGDRTYVDSLVVIWPGGHSQVVTDLAADCRIRVVEAREPAPPPTDARSGSGAGTAGLLEKPCRPELTRRR